MKIENLDKAKVFWGIAKDGAVTTDRRGVPYLYGSGESAEFWCTHLESKAAYPVRIYIIVEDD